MNWKEADYFLRKGRRVKRESWPEEYFLEYDPKGSRYLLTYIGQKGIYGPIEYYETDWIVLDGKT